MKPIEKWSITRWILTAMVSIVAISVFFFVLSSAGLIGEKVVERKVFKNSFQYSEARKTAIATYEAQLAEINFQLQSNDLSDRERNNLQSQAARLRVLLQTERSKQ